MAQDLPKNAYVKGPYDPFSGRGDPDDSAYYISPPGEGFYRPWISVPGGRAFVWPLGVEGFRSSIDPSLGIHRFIGDDRVFVDVMHLGEERISLSGLFPGDTGEDAFRALREVIYANPPEDGKILYVPHMFSYTQRVQVANASFDRAPDDRGHDINYSIEFVRLGPGTRVGDPVIQQAIPQPKVTAKGKSASTFKVDSAHNTLRKIAAFKLKDANKWVKLYDLNEKLFTKLKVNKHRAPTYVIRLGTVIRL